MFFSTYNLEKITLRFLNSRVVTSLLAITSPTIMFEIGQLAQLPVSLAPDCGIDELVDQAIELAKADSEEEETTYDFIAPPDWHTGVQDVAERHAQLAQIEREIDEEVYRLYGISEEDRRAIEAELAETAEAGSEDIEEGEPS